MEKFKSPKFSEIGFFNLNAKETIYNDKNLNFFPKKVSVFQWHSYEVCSLRNLNTENLATKKVARKINSSDTKVMHMDFNFILR